MGADLISTFAWYKTTAPEERTVDLGDGVARTYIHTEPILDFEAADRKVAELTAGYTADDMEEFASRFGYDLDPDEPDTITDCRTEIREQIQGLVDQVWSMFHAANRVTGEKEYWRDIDERRFERGQVGFLYSGGMSWGDGPTEAWEILTALQDEELYPRITEVWTALGFLDDPYDKIGLLP